MMLEAHFVTCGDHMGTDRVRGRAFIDCSDERERERENDGGSLKIKIDIFNYRKTG